jgi:hypothetical protein
MPTALRALIMVNAVLVACVIGLAALLMAPKADAAPTRVSYKTFSLDYVAVYRSSLPGKGCGQFTNKTLAWRNSVSAGEIVERLNEPVMGTRLVRCSATLRVVP